MRLNVDAWLERREPRIRLIDADTGLQIAHLGPEQVQALMDSGDICLGDMDDSSSLVAALFSLLEQEAPDRLDAKRQVDCVPERTRADDARCGSAPGAVGGCGCRRAGPVGLWGPDDARTSS